MHNNVNIISETYEYSIGKSSSILTTPRQFDDSNPRNAFEYLEIVYNCQKLEPIGLHFCRW